MPVPSITIGGITCWVIEESQIETWPGEGGPEIRVTYKCDYADRYTVARALMGTVAMAGDTPVRTEPFQFSRSPNLYALSIGDIIGIGKRTLNADGYWDFEWALVPTLFATPRYQFEGGGDPGGGFVDPSGQPWTTTTVNVSADVIKPPKGGYKFVGSSPVEDVEEGSLGFIFPQVEITFKRHRYPYLPLAEMMALSGRVNDDVMAIGNYTFPAEHLLFAPAGSSQQIDTSGQVVTEVEVKLIGRTKSWNKLPNKAGVWTDINTKADGTGTKPFLLGNFSLLP